MIKKKQFEKCILNLVMTVALIMFALLHVNQGANVTDTGYNYGNFIYFDSLDSMWKFSTYLASVIGHLFTCLPYGHSVLGLNIYTGLVKALISIVVYYVSVNIFNIKPMIAFLAELMALGYCWCPTALLYNYITYLFLTLGAILLCVAIQNDCWICFWTAGLCLGLNVFVRLPNISEICLIVAVWYGCLISRKSVRKTIYVTLICISGYAVAILGLLVYVAFRYGINEYLMGIADILMMPSEASGYTIVAMIKGDIESYLLSIKWIIGFVGLLVIGEVSLFVFSHYKMLIRIVFIWCNILLLCIYKKLGMYDLAYFRYSSIEKVGIIFLIISIILSLYVIIFEDSILIRTYAVTVVIIILITPLGSNNHLFSAMNNMFIVTPFVFSFCYEKKLLAKSMPDKINLLELIRITISILVGFAFMQGLLFGAKFVFRDGIDGMRRTEKITEVPVLDGIYTQPQNARNLNGLYAFLTENKLIGMKTILYNDVPGLAFYMDLSPALSSTWPDLDSFVSDKLIRELNEIECENLEGEKPLIILGEELDSAIPKQAALYEYMIKNDYELAYSNELCYLYW